tara:strand:- start:9267 stop:9545 length:279 start_codon:yes stop_codon:yes gene_type:complete
MHNLQNTFILACCDKELIGKTLKDDQREVFIDENFYKGKLIDEPKLAGLLKEAESINLFGKKSVGVAIEKGFISATDIITIDGIEHAIIMKV